MPKPKKKPPLSLLETRHRALLDRVLGCLLPREAAGQAAAALLDVFGSLSSVMGAPQGELAKIPGMTPEAAALLAAASELARESLEEQAAGLLRIFDTASAVDALRPKFLGRKTEAVCLMLLDGRGRILYNNIVCEGSVSAVPVYVRRLVGLCIDYDASTALIAHNHPSGNALPSRNDMVATRQVEIALEGIDATLMDHIIFAGEDHFSFAASQIWDESRVQVRDFCRKELEAARTLEQQILEN